MTHILLFEHLSILYEKFKKNFEVNSQRRIDFESLAGIF